MDKIEKVACPICKKELTLRGLTGHIALAHRKNTEGSHETPEKKIACPTCGKLVKNRGALAGHTYWAHEGGRQKGGQAYLEAKGKPVCPGCHAVHAIYFRLRDKPLEVGEVLTGYCKNCGAPVWSGTVIE